VFARDDNVTTAATALWVSDVLLFRTVVNVSADRTKASEQLTTQVLALIRDILCWITL
jgi:hypothetical protein